MGVGCAKAPASPAQAVSLRVESPETSAAASPVRENATPGPESSGKFSFLWMVVGRAITAGASPDSTGRAIRPCLVSEKGEKRK